MIYLILGIVLGILIAIIVFLATKRYQAPVETILKQLENDFKPKGEIFIESEEDKELNDFLDSLPKA